MAAYLSDDTLAGSSSCIVFSASYDSRQTGAGEQQYICIAPPMFIRYSLSLLTVITFINFSTVSR